MGDETKLPLPFPVHQCNGPVVREVTEDRYHYTFAKCAICHREWLVGQINLDALRRLNLTSLPYNKDEDDGE